MARWLQQYALVAVVATGICVSQLLLKWGMGGEALTMRSWHDVVALIRRVLTTPSLIAGYGLSAIFTLGWLVVLSRMDLSSAVPVLNGVYFVLIAIAATLFFGESLGSLRVLGILLILLGISLVSWQPLP